MKQSAVISQSRSLHFYFYTEDKKIKVENSQHYKNKTLTEYHSFYQALEQKFYFNLTHYNTHKI
ncbi:hypothetical protein EMCG_03364 [[Emmonsia] crescens]|uniref:Uncharacterized protein n=1 Tax=[Emmonsia] crescens TaxID=73230 RepID=A0A0G2HVB4_9EURO|nr:hypothetical protein EMCG_03364 [Emmonsia crescens UAMH 3008]